ncbi:MAG: sortase [Candidatus Berkelbacteria bacterium]|nr:sortase [Candidatus Berkelbacteria bacterium]
MNQHHISENDLLNIFAHETKRKRDKLAPILRFINRFFLIASATIAIYLFVNYPAFHDKILFWYKSDIKAETPTLIAPEIGTAPIAAVSDETRGVSTTQYVPDLSENEIYIPSLQITAPITWRVPNVATKVSDGLSKGVIQVDGTALPGQNGNVYITGHSSNYVWAKGNYNSIFAVINRLVAGDLVYLNYRNKIFTYKVTDQKVVAASDLSIMAQTDGARLSIVTCWPVGTSFKRMVVLADQISPDPALNSSSDLKNDGYTQLPSAR